LPSRDGRSLTTAASSPTTVEQSALSTVEVCRRERTDQGSMKNSPKIRPTALTIVRMSPTIGIATAPVRNETANRMIAPLVD
jgi:hypothetical protein